HLGLVFKTLLGPSIISAVGALGIQFFANRMMEGTSHQPVVMPVIAILGSLLMVLIAKWVLTVRQLSFVRMAAGFDNNYATAHQWMSKRKWQVLGLAALAFSAGVVFFVVWMIEVIGAAALSKGGVLMSVLSVLGLVTAPFGMLASGAIVLLVGF